MTPDQSANRVLIDGKPFLAFVSDSAATRVTAALATLNEYALLRRDGRGLVIESNVEDVK